MKKKLIGYVTGVAMILSVFSVPLSASALIPGGFGGPILMMVPCLYPFGGWRITLGPPSFGSYIYQTGLSISFLFGPPWHIGQYLLGMSTGIGSCATYYDDGWGGWMSGGYIIFHGSSI